MDRRYNQSRFYNGTPATDRSINKSDSLVRSYLARARKQNASNQSYGGSVGGRSSIDNQYTSGRVSEYRAAETPDRNKVFKEEGIGVYGARRASNESRKPLDLGS
jgi:hypothetical protein